MKPLPLHAFHAAKSASFTEVNGSEAVAHYGNPEAEYSALNESAGVLDLSFRSRICLTGADRVRFLHGQITNELQKLPPGRGCYAALVSAKGRMESDLFVYVLPDELLLDFEPGFQEAVSQRLDKYIIADDVEVIDVAPHYGLLAVQGPAAAKVLGESGIGVRLADAPLGIEPVNDPAFGELYVVNQTRLGKTGFDLFIPNDSLVAVAGKLFDAVRKVGGRACGWEAFEPARIESGIPRFGVDMDETNLAPEAIPQAISYSKGCYTGQEVIARIRTYGQVARALRRLRLEDELPALPRKGDKLFQGQKEMGYITSAARIPGKAVQVALGYVRRECNQPGTTLHLRFAQYEGRVRVMEL